MPDKKTTEKARRDKREGKSASTQAGEFVREEMHHIREGKHGARNAKQAIAIGLSEARRAGVDIPDKRKAAAKRRTTASRSGDHEASSTRSRAALKALKKEGHGAASHTALSRQAHSAAAKRSPASRSAAAKKAASTRAKSK